LLNNPPITTPNWILEEIQIVKNTQGIKEQIKAAGMSINMFEIAGNSMLTIFFIALTFRIYVKRLNLGLVSRENEEK
jgi:hypothetical protein